MNRLFYDRHREYQDLLSILTITTDRSKNTFITTSWNALTPIWQGETEVVQTGLPHSQLPPAWQMLLLGDGSPTRHLQLLTGEGTRVRRRVWLRSASGQRLAYASSWWEARHVDEYLENKSLPIWASLAKLRTELYRDVQGIYCGESPALAQAFGETGPFWGRHYLFWHHGKPLTLIYEVFSPYLQQYVGKIEHQHQSPS